MNILFDHWPLRRFFMPAQEVKPWAEALPSLHHLYQKKIGSLLLFKDGPIDLEDLPAHDPKEYMMSIQRDLSAAIWSLPSIINDACLIEKARLQGYMYLMFVSKVDLLAIMYDFIQSTRHYSNIDELMVKLSLAYGDTNAHIGDKTVWVNESNYGGRAFILCWLLDHIMFGSADVSSNMEFVYYAANHKITQLHLMNATNHFNINHQKTFKYEYTLGG